MAINLDSILASTGSIQTGTICKSFFFPSTTSLNWGSSLVSLWQISGTPGSGSIPVTASLGGQIYDTDSSGSFYISWNSNKDIYLYNLSMVGNVGSCILYDRIWSCSISGINTSVQNISSMPSIPNRYLNNEGLELWLEVEATQTNSLFGSSVLTVTYTNNLGQPNRIATISLSSSRPKAGEMIPFTLQNGDSGINGVTSFQMVGGTANIILHLIILKRLSQFGSTRYNGGTREGYVTSNDIYKTGFMKIPSGSCLNLIYKVSNPADDFVGNFFGQISFLEVENA